MRFTIQHQGVPVGTFEADRGAIGSVIVQTLPAFDSVRREVAAWWALPTTDVRVDAQNARRIETNRPRPIFDLVDDLGRYVPASQIDLCISGPTTALALIMIDESRAPVPSTVPLPPRNDTAAHEV